MIGPVASSGKQKLLYSLWAPVLQERGEVRELNIPMEVEQAMGM